jgi:phosphatidylglycerol:prolipoprotein diacylglycerol transferase
LLALGFSMGQWLSLPMIVAGIGLLAWSYLGTKTGTGPRPR